MGIGPMHAVLAYGVRAASIQTHDTVSGLGLTYMQIVSLISATRFYNQ